MSRRRNRPSNNGYYDLFKGWIEEGGYLIKPAVTIGLNGNAYHFKDSDVAYQAFKCPEKMYEFTRLDESEARELGKKVPLRPDWEQIKGEVKAFLRELNEDESHAGNANHLCKDFCKMCDEKRKENFEQGVLLDLTDAKVAHCHSVARFMMDNAKDYGISPDVAYLVGYLHDIGYIYGRLNHEKSGADLLELVDVNKTIRNTISLHGTDPYLIPDNMRQYSEPLLALLYDADMSVDARGRIVGHENRLKDIAIRYGEDHIAYQTALSEVQFVEEYKLKLEKEAKGLEGDMSDYLDVPF
jgi:putative nucleotidyltransferase with HDIG domain